MTYAFIHVQCKDSNGKLGTFIAQKEDRIAISPVFDGLYQLYPWMKENDWETNEYDATGNGFTPWRVSKTP